MKSGDTKRPEPCTVFAVEPLEPRVQLSGNFVSWLLAVSAGQYNPKSVTAQPGGYDPHISLLPFGEK